MKPFAKILKYLLAAIFWLIGLFFLGTGIRDVAGCLTEPGAPLSGSLIAMAFLVLFAWIAIAYGLFLFREARAGGPAPEKAAGVMQRVNPVEVLGLLVFGLAPVVFVLLNGASREFAREREAAFQQIRPAFLRYVAEHQRAPRQLEQLVPDYLPGLPAVIILDESAGPAKRVRYEAAKQSARLHYRSGGWPSYPRAYDLVTGQIVVE